jgi:hypothetical protein
MGSLRVSREGGSCIAEQNLEDSEEGVVSKDSIVDLLFKLEDRPAAQSTTPMFI